MRLQSGKAPLIVSTKLRAFAPQTRVTSLEIHVHEEASKIRPIPDQNIQLLRRCSGSDVWCCSCLNRLLLRNLGIWRPGDLENPEMLRSGDLEIQKFGVQTMEKIQILKIQIRSAQNVGEVWFRRKNHLFQAISGRFPWTGMMQK